MAYKNFKLENIENDLGIIHQSFSFLPTHLPNFVPTNMFMTILNENSHEPIYTEKAKSEMIITPTLMELKRQNNNKFSFFSGYEFNVDAKLLLKGYCDFLLSAVPNSLIIKSPVFCLVEAKKGEIEEGFGQCAAEMYAAQIFNEKNSNNNLQKIIYGCVTNGFTWAFLKLENKNLLIDTNYVPFTFNEPNKVLSVLQWILDETLPNTN